jgi:hypothetical protein
MSASGASRTTASVSGAMLRTLLTLMAFAAFSAASIAASGISICNQRVVRCHLGHRPFGVFSRDFAVGAGNDGNHVLAVAADQDQCCAGRSLDMADKFEIGSGFTKQGKRLGGEGVIADRAAHLHRCSGPLRRQRLVGALAALRRGEIGCRSPSRLVPEVSAWWRSGPC